MAGGRSILEFPFLWRRFLSAGTLASLVACGASVKRADQVDGIFGNVANIQTKLRELCDILQAREEPPNLSGIGLAHETCVQGGLRAARYDENRDLEFMDMRTLGQKFSTATGGIDQKNTLLRFQTRTEVWLNRPLIRLVSSVLPRLNDKTNGIFSDGGSADGTGDQEDFTVNVLEESSFDGNTRAYQALIELLSERDKNGLVDISNQFSIRAALLAQKYIAATVETTEKAIVEGSIVESGKLLFLLIPHANDILFIVLSDMNLHDFGVHKSMQDKFFSSLSNALKFVNRLFASASPWRD